MSRDGWKARWEMVDPKKKPLGVGGQGEVFQVRDKKKSGPEMPLGTSVKDFIRQIASGRSGQPPQEILREFERILQEINNRNAPTLYGALKILHKPEEARDPELAQERLTREIAAMQAADHPHLLKILDASAGESLEDEKWYVSEYHPRGSLHKNPNLFQGDAEGSLRALRGIVDGVASLHPKDIVHRDIKPENIFFAEDGRLVLGDFGLVCVQDGALTRLSGSQDNVGSRDWMPPWEYAPGTGKITPAFDVFSLCKVLWAMIVGADRVMQLWYYDDSRFNLEQRFPGRHRMKVVNSLLAKCIVQYEHQCLLPDATSLLLEMDLMLEIIELGGNLLDEDTRRPCKVCGRGEYILEAGPNSQDLDTFSLQKNAVRSFRVFACNYCGHMEVFSVPGGPKGDPLPAWK